MVPHSKSSLAFFFSVSEFDHIFASKTAESCSMKEKISSFFASQMAVFES